MLKPPKWPIFRKSVFRSKSAVRRINALIADSLPQSMKAKVVIHTPGPDAIPVSGKVVPEIFFPPFCRVLGQCGISSVYVHSIDDLEQEILESTSIPTILINLIHELYDDLDKLAVSNLVFQDKVVEFNSLSTAGIICNKYKANQFFSKNDVLVPRLDPKNCKIFSNTIIGTKSPVMVYETIEDADKSRYNTEYIDTTLEFRNKKYFSTIRLICIGSIIVQIYARAADIEKGNPSVHNADTPLDPDLMEHMYNSLVMPNLHNFRSIANRLENILGPGFYVHDLLIDQESGKTYLSETGFKFFDTTYSKHMIEVTGNRKFLTGVMDMETFAAYSATIFVNYCASKGFF